MKEIIMGTVGLFSELMADKIIAPLFLLLASSFSSFSTTIEQDLRWSRFGGRRRGGFTVL
jgi:hypothetical protein